MIANDAHDREYAAAAANLHEQTPSPTFAIGDYVSGRYADGKHWTGKVIWIDTDGMLAVESQGSWHRAWPKNVVLAMPSDVTH